METSVEIVRIWLPLLVAALVQASFSLGVSMLTLLSGHLMSETKSRGRLRKLSLSYITGAIFATLLLLLALSLLLTLIRIWLIKSGSMDGGTSWTAIWWVIITVVFVVGTAIMLFYYRSGKAGTRLWLPRRAAEYLDERTRATRRGFEAFMLGIGSVVAELPFVIAPLLVVAYLTSGMSGLWPVITQLAVYTAITILPLLILFISNLGGRKISTFQKWREHNKRFLQFAAGGLLIILGFYLLTYQVLGG
jgi:cytochrome c biogenesis protein CcdA